MSHKTHPLSSRLTLIGTMLCATIFPLSLLPNQQAQAQSIYQTTDKHGNVAFTDNPHHGGTRIHLSPLPLLPSMAPQQIAPIAASQPMPEANQAQASPGQPFMPYDTFAINTPANNQTLPQGAAGNVQVLLNIRPTLRKDHQTRLLLNGNVSQSAMHTTTFMLSNLSRGSHQLQAELLDASGTVRHRTPAQTLHVHRASIHMPHNPNNPNASPRPVIKPTH
ncbi:DUF4124 domain-containing protein [Halomonas halocynthiae]|uniref:DUF4124 domain-containing protein n=1 Tax=Halomonas halocynthiae TaxID=176290 RepID=UPI00040353B4|nr:DUF4124 domain-containing protein [Halomonas halocynthiae]